MSPQPFFELRGTPINVLQMVRALCGAGYEVHLATYPIGDPVRVEGLVHHRSLSVRWMNQVSIGFSLRKVVLDALLALRVWRLLLTRRFDVVHAVEESIFFTLPLARLRRMPVIYDLDSSLSDQLASSGVLRARPLLALARSLEATALRSSQLAITVCSALTERVRESASELPVVQIEDVPLAESLRTPNPEVERELLARFGPGPLAVYTGNLASYQGVDLLLDALPSLAERIPGARILIVGGTAREVAALRERLATHPHGAMVTLAGAQPPELLPELMAIATVLVSPRREGINTPLKLYTYMHSGVPIVATDIPAHTQLLDDRTALLCAPTAEALADAIARVMARPSAFADRALRARDLVRRSFSPEEFRRKLLAGYDALLAGEHGAERGVAAR
ncbi:MAG TPA: glycosyltransferase family 4 protein [Gemmatimonadaceae bacterium]|nr:glycosyltransferase family 4 protein [Gemmatimonadaceae bacterium]